MQSAFFCREKSSLNRSIWFLLNYNAIFAVVRRCALFFLNKLNRAGSFTFFVLICIHSFVQAQVDPQFSQYMFNPLSVNPGFTGISGRINAVAANRQQWVGFEGAPKTTVVGADMALNFFGNPGGVGLTILNDEVGYISNINIQASLAQRFDLGEGLISVGFSLGFFNQVWDGTKLFTSTPSGGSYHMPTDNLVPGTEVKGTSFDVGIGAYYKHEKYYGGISILHLFEPKPNFNDDLNVYLPRSFFITGGYNYALWEAPVVLKPSFLIKGVGPIWQLDLNLTAIYQDRYWGGVSYRPQDAIVLITGVELASGVRIGYSYDITTSRLAKVSGGSHEVMVGYTFDLNLEKREKKYKSVRFL